MSAPPLSKLIRFLLIAAGLIIIFSVAWSFVDAGYSNFLGQIAGSLVSDEFKVEQTSGTIYFTRLYFPINIGGTITKLAVPSNYPPDAWIDASAIQFGLLLTIALMAATPGLKLRRRFILCAIAAAITFILQVLSVVIMAKTLNSLLFVIVSDVFPPILWAAFSFKYWFAGPVSAPCAQVEPPPAENKKGKKSK
jgi:hypothetical protein